MNIRISRDLDEAGRVWNELWPAGDIFSRWDARVCFQQSFGRPVHFIIAESGGRPAGFVGLSRIDEEGSFGQFPGATWKGRTWFEQNRIPAGSDITRMILWEAVPDGSSLRYLVEDSAGAVPGSTLDETGYLFRPPLYGFDFNRYWGGFSGKSRKKIGREIDALGDLEYSHDGLSPSDIEWMFETNRAVFGPDSFFDDPRFLSGFEKMLSLLAENGMLHVLTVRSGGRRAAVDAGAVCGGRYTVLAGATGHEFPGIAKAMNLEQIRWSCSMRFDSVDFLCGDFGWKERFHLEPRPLYILNKAASGEPVETVRERKSDLVIAS